jgi:hypothetical protein
MASFWGTTDLLNRVTALSDRTKVPKAELIRCGLEMLLTAVANGQRPWESSPPPGGAKEDGR